MNFHVFVYFNLQTNFSQNCLLYADVVYENYTSSTSNTATYFLFRTRFGAKSVCLYNIVIAAIFSLAYAVAMILGYTFLYRKETSEKTWAIVLFCPWELGWPYRVLETVLIISLWSVVTLSLHLGTPVIPSCSWELW